MAIPTPKLRTYRYIGSSLHVFSTIWLGVLIGVTWLAFQVPDTAGQYVVKQVANPINPIVTFVGAIVLIGLFAVGVWVQATCWIERIKLGPDGIEMYGWNGKLKIRAKLGEIKSIDVDRSRKLDVMQIETMSGAIKATSHLRGFNDLAKQVNDIIESFNEGLKPLAQKL